MATEDIGYKGGAGGSWYNADDSLSWSGKVLATPTSNGTLNSITVTMDGNGYARYFKFALYSDDAANNMPGSLIANSPTVEGNTASSTPVDITLNIAGGTCNIVAGTTYWIIVHIKTGNYADFYYDTGITGGVSSYKAMAYDTWSSWGGTENGHISDVRFSNGYFTITTATPPATVETIVYPDTTQVFFL